MNDMREIVYRTLSKTRMSRRIMRKVARKTRAYFHVPDPYADLLTMFKTCQPTAILDIGAYDGRTALRFADEFGDVPIHAFEPTPDSFEQLARRVAEYPKVNVHQLALANECGFKHFFRNRSAETNSLLDNGSGNNSVLCDVTAHVDCIKVQVVRLDDWVAANVPHGKLLMKIDVQGAEGLLLDGGRKTFTDQVAAVFCETAMLPMYDSEPTFFEMQERMTRQFGFVLGQIYPCVRDGAGRALYCDALWLRTDFCVSKP